MNFHAFYINLTNKNRAFTLSCYITAMLANKTTTNKT